MSPLDFAAIERARHEASRQQIAAADVQIAIDRQNSPPNEKATSVATTGKTDRTRRGQGPWIEILTMHAKRRAEVVEELALIDQEIAYNIDAGMSCGASLRALAEITGLSPQGVSDLHKRHFQQTV